VTGREKLSKPRWLNTDVSWRYRLKVTVPMHALGVAENLVGLASCGFIQPGWSLHVGLKRALVEARRARAGEATTSG
jgi:hypothetical protein